MARVVVAEHLLLEQLEPLRRAAMVEMVLLHLLAVHLSLTLVAVVAGCFLLEPREQVELEAAVMVAQAETDQALLEPLTLAVVAVEANQIPALLMVLAAPAAAALSS